MASYVSNPFIYFAQKKSPNCELIELFWFCINLGGDLLTYQLHFHKFALCSVPRDACVEHRSKKEQKPKLTQNLLLTSFSHLPTLSVATYYDARRYPHVGYLHSPASIYTDIHQSTPTSTELNTWRLVTYLKAS